MNYLNRYLASIATSFLLFSCAVTSPTLTDYDRDADFSKYRSYYWSDEFQQAQHTSSDNPLFYNTLNKKRLKKAIEEEMDGRGYRLDMENPDLLVEARVNVEQKNQTTSQNRNPYIYGWYFPDQTITTTTRKEGGVVIGLIDKDEKQLVWQGYAPDVIQLFTEDKQAQIHAAVSKIFSNYRYRAGS